MEIENVFGKKCSRPDDESRSSEQRGSDGRFAKGVRASVATEFKKGQHWREHRVFREKEYLLGEYVEKERSASDIATEHGVTEDAILFWLRKHSIPRRSTKQIRSKKRWGMAGEKNGMHGMCGEKNPRWRGGSSPERQTVYSREIWKNVAKNVYQRDGYKCQRCGSGNTELNAHHIKSWAEYPSLRLEESNIVTLCKPCHLWVHSKKNKNGEFIES